MSDPSAALGGPTATDPIPDKPITVNAAPWKDQAGAALRVLLIACSTLALGLHFLHASAFLTMLANESGPIVAVFSAAIGLGTLIWSQISTRISSRKKATMANLLPDNLARTK